MSRPDEPGEGKLGLAAGRWSLSWESAGAGIVAAVQGRAVSTGDAPPAGSDVLPPAARVRQVHGADIVVATGRGDCGTGDALVTTAKGLPLLVRVADCVPVFLAAPGGVAVAHAGWRGTVAGIAAKTARRLAETSGDDPSTLRAWIGPAIGLCCYEVGEEVADRFESRHRQTIDGTIHLDLAAANRDALIGAGVPAGAIALSGRCTRCEQHLFHSHRGSGGKPGRTDAWIMRLSS